MEEMNTLDWIETVVETEYGWVVNGTLHVPNDPANRDCRDVMEWLSLRSS